MELTIKTKKLSAIVKHKSTYEPNKLQVGYYLNGHWIGVHNIYKERGGWKSDNYSGWYKTISEWKAKTLDKVTTGMQ